LDKDMAAKSGHNACDYSTDKDATFAIIAPL